MEIDAILESYRIKKPNCLFSFLLLTLFNIFLQNVDPDYSCPYVTVHTDGDLCGHGLTFTIGRGNDIGEGQVTQAFFLNFFFYYLSLLQVTSDLPEVQKLHKENL